MQNLWIRLWLDMPNDPKWRTIARAAKQPIPLVISVAIHLMVSAGNNPQRGVTQCNAEDVASALDVEIEAVESVIKAMQGRYLDGQKLTGWEKRQPLREDNSALRVKAYRERQAVVTQCNAPVTQSNAREDKIREDKNIDTVVCGVAQKRTRPPIAGVLVFNGNNEGEIKPRAVVGLSQDFDWPDDGDVAKQTERLGFTAARATNELEKFVAYYTLGKGSDVRRTVKGWRQAWFNWLDRSTRYAK